MQSAGPVQLPEAFSSVFGLGAPLSYFPVKKLNRWGAAVAAVILLGAAGAILLGGLYVTYTDVQAHGPAVIERNLLPTLGFSFVSLLLGIWAAWSAFANWNRSAVAYENGFAYQDRKGLQSWRWDDVALFYQAVTRHYTNGIYTGTTYVYTLQKPDGSRIRFDNGLNKVQDLGRLAAQKVSTHQYQQATEVYNSGKTASFGPVGLNKSGIAIGKKVYAWTEIQQVSISRGFLTITRKGGGLFSGATASAASIPNLEVLLAIIDQVVGVKSGR